MELVMKRKIELCMTLLLLVGMIVASRKLSQLVTSDKVETRKDIVVIDAGHGGEDPGKVGVNGALEKDINLQIAKKVEEHLEKQGVQVVMTREDDQTEASKRKDMEKRVALINEVKPIIAVSVHQNSYTDPSIKGAQVFYYTDSKKGESAASLMQEELRKVDVENTRQIKENNNYYMLKNTKTPIIIVECGFLSNVEEATKLMDEEYQEKMAEAIAKGILGWIAGE